VGEHELYGAGFTDGWEGAFGVLAGFVAWAFEEDFVAGGETLGVDLRLDGYFAVELRGAAFADDGRLVGGERRGGRERGEDRRGR
jgi:hypothetical protein